MRIIRIGLAICALPLCADVVASERCSNYVENKQALFGDLHVHTGFSMDAYTFDTHTGPDEAYRFAKGEAIRIAPLGKDGKPSHEVKMSRPLDFAAVTDHAENLAGVSLCTRKDSAVYSTESCRVFREGDSDEPAVTFEDIVKQVTTRSKAVDMPEVCGEDGKRCRDGLDHPWLLTQQAAESHYDRSDACQFTSFVGYEYSFTPEYSKVHRNIIFRNENVIRRPIHAMYISEPLSMLAQLRSECQETEFDDGCCDVVSIPHNSNYSDGRMFRADYGFALNAVQQASFAKLRASMEPVVEIMQIKGDSECSNGLPGVAGGSDEFCNFEKTRQMLNDSIPSCNGEIGAGALMGRGCLARNDFVRYALAAGLAEQQRIGVNPFQFGFAASTDVHDGTMGDTEEAAYADPQRNVSAPSSNPGGLFGVWAEENRRDSIFDSIRAREVFGTSGTRIKPRLFAGWNLDKQLCNSPDMISKAYSQAVPMGGELPGNDSTSKVPGFLVSAQADTQGSRLERIQIVKVWPGEEGEYQQRVFNVAGGPIPGASLDEQSCEPIKAGASALCSVWEDPEFDPDQSAVYYSRVLELPSCRWTRQRCNALPESEQPAWCADPRIPGSVQERAWTSPIWYSADNSGN
ncbi:MAG: DUF3604 domain-containing protein [Pseudomonadales bacterium]